jgi:hypothetical protein
VGKLWGHYDEIQQLLETLGRGSCYCQTRELSFLAWSRQPRGTDAVIELFVVGFLHPEAEVERHALLQILPVFGLIG